MDFFKNFPKRAANPPQDLKDCLPKTCKNRAQQPSGGKFPQKAADGKAGEVTQPQVAHADAEAKIDPGGEGGQEEKQVGGVGEFGPQRP